ncbi:MAG: HU family DNA-binding protein, partial [Planctomycetota bacterium]
MTTKKEIVKQICDKTALPQAQVREIVQSTLDAIINTVLEEGKIELRNFGVFKVKKR